jgi:hypothetical protein
LVLLGSAVLSCSLSVPKERVAEMMKRFKRGILAFLLTVVLLITTFSSSQGAVIENSLVVTDVTPMQFCVVWGTEEPATGWVSVFLDPEGTRPSTGAVVKQDSAAHRRQMG